MQTESDLCGCSTTAYTLPTILELALRDASIAISLIGEGHTTIWSNRATDSLLGMPAASVLDTIDQGEQGWRFFDAAGARYDFLAAIERCIEIQEPFGPSLIGVRRPDGSLFWGSPDVSVGVSPR